MSLLLALLDDILLVSVLGTAIYSITLRGTLPGGALPVPLFTSYFIMTGIEVLRTLTAFWFKRRRGGKTLLLIPLLRFGYRQLLYIGAIRGVVTGADRASDRLVQDRPGRCKTTGWRAQTH